MMDVRTLILVTESAYQLKKYIDSNPEVGMGPSINTIVDQVLKNTKHPLSQEDIERVEVLVSLREVIRSPLYDWLYKFNNKLNDCPVMLLISKKNRESLKEVCHYLRSGEPV